MLTVVPTSWLGWNFQVQGPTSEAIAEVRLSSWRERGRVVVAGSTYEIYRDGWVGPFILQGPDDSIGAIAMKPSVWRREFQIAHEGQRYALKATGAFRRACGLFRGERRLGSIAPTSWSSRRATVELAEELPRPMVAFAIWLTLLLWKRESDAAAGG